MICHSCAEAGDILAMSRDLPRVKMLGEALAIMYHAECTDCDCQHKLNNPHHQ